MFALFTKKSVAIDVKLDQANELSALHAIADTAADKLGINAQGLKASFIASEVQGTHLIADRILLTHTTTPDVRTPKTVLLSFKDPILWGATGIAVDFALAIVMPAQAPEGAYATLAASAEAHLVAAADTLDALRSNASALNQLNRTLLD
ncbi:PTS sugar transporter subunit IIA [Lacticaseibacillus absianus]|uniref:PTS sugar transporter subunit IIA n=1 Tax=Lacticaseibacillus absianus TaxID=2729623 RepID=UPI0015C72100|nr:PTS sugar transporter subunit IIA [Lacticaseibacillus absianus]